MKGIFCKQVICGKAIPLRSADDVLGTMSFGSFMLVLVEIAISHFLDIAERSESAVDIELLPFLSPC